MAERIRPGSLRRRAGFVLAWTGAFLLGTGIMLRTYVYYHVAVLPLDTYAVTRLHATGATYFDPAVLRTRTGLNVSATSTLRGDVRAAKGDTAVYETFLAVQATDGTPIEYVRTRLALNRHTGLLVSCCGAHVGRDTHLDASGLGFKFPFFARKTTYELFDSDVRRPVPATYGGQASIDGMPVYRYLQILPASQIGSRRVPQSIMGLRSRPVQIKVRDLAATTETFWVDPVTGVPIKVEENTRQYLQTRDGKHTRLVFAADFKQAPADVAATVRRFQAQSRELALVRGALPVGGVLAGVALIAVGAVLVFDGGVPGSGRRRGAMAGSADEEAVSQVTRADAVDH
jgi:Porin PorA